MIYDMIWYDMIWYADMCSLTAGLVYMVWEDQYDGNLAQLCHAGDVSTVLRRALCRHAMSNSRRVRPRNLRVLCSRNDRQDHCHGSSRSADVPRRHLEPTRLLHRRCRVIMHVAFRYFVLFLPTPSPPLFFLSRCLWRLDLGTYAAFHGLWNSYLRVSQ